jgi:glycosyltransferase involved in cell wall biosynthesis
MFDAPSDRVHVIPNGVEEVFFQRTPNQELRTPRSDYLVCTAAITQRKRVVELAEAAVLAGTPLWIIGAPYSDSDPYYLRFLDVVRGSGGLLRYEGSIGDRAQMADIYSSARGFVLLSSMESMSLSALEAAAAGCPLLLSDLPWAQSTFGDNAFYCPLPFSRSSTADCLHRFHADAESSIPSFTPQCWRGVAESLSQIYTRVLAG